jgi:hypothetical protein
MHSSTSVSMTLTVFQLISSRAGKGWYVTFISSFSTPGMSNLAVTCCAQKRRGSKRGFDEHVDRCDPHPGSIGGLLELHTTRNVVVSYVRAYIYMWGGRETHIDRCLLKGGAGEGTRPADCADGSRGTPLNWECRIGGDLPLSRDLIFDGEAAISRSLALRTAPHTWSSGSESPGVMGPDELVEAWEP